MQHNRYNFFIKSMGLHLQTRHDGFYTSMVWYKKDKDRTIVVENSVRAEDYDKFIGRVAKLKLCNL